MGFPEETQLELLKISSSLSKSVHSASPEQWKKIVRKTIRDIDNLIGRLDKSSPKPAKKKRS